MRRQRLGIFGARRPILRRRRRVGWHWRRRIGRHGFACDLTAPTPLVTNVNAMFSIALDADSVYYIADEYDKGVIAYRVAKTGGTPVPLVTLAIGRWSQLAVDDANVYVIDSGANGIRILPKAGGPGRLVPVRGFRCPDASPLALTTFGGHVYWTQTDYGRADPGCSGGGDVVDLPPGSDAPVMLYQTSGPTFELFVDATHIFWGDDVNTMRGSRTGGSAELLDTQDGSSACSDGSSLYLAYGHFVYAITAPSMHHAVYENPNDYIYGLTADATHVWIASSQLLRVDLPGGATTVVSDAPPFGAVAVDDHYAYYFDRNHEILKACR